MTSSTDNPVSCSLPPLLSSKTCFHELVLLMLFIKLLQHDLSRFIFHEAINIILSKTRSYLKKAEDSSSAVQAFSQDELAGWGFVAE